jgi:hypothetical protein
MVADNLFLVPAHDHQVRGEDEDEQEDENEGQFEGGLNEV